MNYMIGICSIALLGLFIEESTLYGSKIALFCFVMMIVLSSALFLFDKKNIPSSLVQRCALLFFVLGFFIVRGQFIQEKENTPLFFYEKNTVKMEILEKDEEELYTNYKAQTLYKGDVYVFYVKTSTYPSFSIGERLLITGALQEKNELLYDEKTKKIIKYVPFLEGEGIAGVYFFPRIEKDTTNHISVSKLHTVAFAQQRRFLEEKIHHFVSGEEGDLAAATLFGGFSLTKEEKVLFKNAGISHIVALSGFNISILLLFLSALLFFLPFWFRLIFSTFFILFYIQLVSMSGSLFRASLMALIGILMLARGILPDARKVLLTSFFFIELVFPKFALHDISLHLSMLAMIGVLFVYPYFFKKEIDDKRGVKRFLEGVFFETVSVYLLIIPYTLFLFGQASLYGIFSTMLVTFFVPTITIFSLLLVLIPHFLFFISYFFSSVAFFFSHCVFIIAKSIITFPGNVIVTSISFTGLFMLYIIIFILLFCIKYNNKKKRRDKEILAVSQKEDDIEGIIYF